MNRIEQIIKNEFDSRMELAVITYLLEVGTRQLKNVTEDDILKVKGNAIMTDEFSQALVRAAVKIAKEISEIDICKYIRSDLWMSPAMRKVAFYKSEYEEEDWEILCDEWNTDELQDSFVVNASVEEGE